MRTFNEVEYRCKCGHTQTIRYFSGEPPLPVTCCVKCRAGFGVELNVMLATGKGMYPGKATVVTDGDREYVEAPAA